MRTDDQRAGAALALSLMLVADCADAAERADSALTGYVGRITTVNAWHEIVTEPGDVEFADAYLAALALSYTLDRYREDARSVLSWATEVPEVEVELETSSEQLLIYWMWEMTFAPPGSRWAAVIRLRHRSKGFGLLADDGGMNAPAAGVRVEF